MYAIIKFTGQPLPFLSNSVGGVSLSSTSGQQMPVEPVHEGVSTQVTAPSFSPPSRTADHATEEHLTSPSPVREDREEAEEEERFFSAEVPTNSSRLGDSTLGRLAFESQINDGSAAPVEPQQLSQDSRVTQLQEEETPTQKATPINSQVSMAASTAMNSTRSSSRGLRQPSPRTTSPRDRKSVV